MMKLPGENFRNFKKLLTNNKLLNWIYFNSEIVQNDLDNSLSKLKNSNSKAYENFLHSCNILFSKTNITRFDEKKIIKNFPDLLNYFKHEPEHIEYLINVISHLEKILKSICRRWYMLTEKEILTYIG